MTTRTVSQNELRGFTGKHVHQHCSQLIEHLLETATESEYYDQLMQVSRQENYREACEYEGWAVAERDGWTCIIRGDRVYDDCLNSPVDIEDLDEDCDIDPDDANVWRLLAESEGIEPDSTDACEYWIVSDNLAHWLGERGEMVSTDIYGLTVWGRAGTGQAIYMDSVIRKIYAILLEARAA